VVPRFYLRGFANGRDQIRRVTLGNESAHLLAISDASVIKDFYTVTLPDGTQSDVFESAFGEIEGAAAESLRAIKGGVWPVEGQARADLATWIGLQLLRSEDVRADQGRLKAELIRIIIGSSGKQALRRLIEGSEGRPISEDELDWEWRDLTKPGGPALESNANEHIRLVTSLLDGTAHYLHDCHWTLVKFDHMPLITSDHPVSMLVGPDYPSWRGIGIMTAEMFLVPLTRGLALTIQPRDRLERIGFNAGQVPDFVCNGTTEWMLSINAETAAGARRYVYHHPGDTPLDGIALPSPGLDRPLSTDNRLVREDGLFADMTDEQRAGLRAAAPRTTRDRGMSIDDLTWPIPGRRSKRAASEGP
jgi:hypothetical protein